MFWPLKVISEIGKNIQLNDTKKKKKAQTKQILLHHHSLNLFNYCCQIKWRDFLLQGNNRPLSSWNTPLCRLRPSSPQRQGREEKRWPETKGQGNHDLVSNCTLPPFFWTYNFGAIWVYLPMSISSKFSKPEIYNASGSQVLSAFPHVLGPHQLTPG